jgi:hypothetical protein
MKILMTKSWEQAEYLDDSLLHGLRSLEGDNIIDSPRMWFMYENSFGPNKKDLTSIVGRGYTYYGAMNDDQIDRTDIETKIKLGYFDLILCHSWYVGPYHRTIIDHTPPRKIVWLDGRDERQVLTQFIGTGWYFKRELTQAMTGVKPISFVFPEEKIQEPIEKTRSVAHCIAGDTSTYIFKDEQSYYNQYNESLFGITKCKGGWDCSRHYEILGSRCVPWFVDVAFCPITTCTTLPKDDFRIINNMINIHGPDAIMTGSLRDEYDEVSNRIHNHFIEKCTTKALAKYLLDTIK